MANRKGWIMQADVRRCLRATREAGFAEARMEIVTPDGTRITIVAGKGGVAAPDDPDDIDAMIERVPHAVS